MYMVSLVSTLEVGKYENFYFNSLKDAKVFASLDEKCQGSDKFVEVLKRTDYGYKLIDIM